MWQTFRTDVASLFSHFQSDWSMDPLMYRFMTVQRYIRQWLKLQRKRPDHRLTMLVCSNPIEWNSCGVYLPKLCSLPSMRHSYQCHLPKGLITNLQNDAKDINVSGVSSRWCMIYVTRSFHLIHLLLDPKCHTFMWLWIGKISPCKFLALTWIIPYTSKILLKHQIVQVWIQTLNLTHNPLLVKVSWAPKPQNTFFTSALKLFKIKQSS